MGDIISDRVKGGIACFAYIHPITPTIQTISNVYILLVIEHKCISTTIKCWREFRQLLNGYFSLWNMYTATYGCMLLCGKSLPAISVTSFAGLYPSPAAD